MPIDSTSHQKSKRNFDSDLYRLYYIIENTFLKFKRWCGIASRYFKTSDVFCVSFFVRSIFLSLVFIQSFCYHTYFLKLFSLKKILIATWQTKDFSLPLIMRFGVFNNNISFIKILFFTWQAMIYWLYLWHGVNLVAHFGGALLCILEG